jgi:hypothetical protein
MSSNQGALPSSPSSGRAARTRVDFIAIGAVLLIAIGWFGLSTVVFTAGRFAQPTRFYELLAIMYHPVLLLTGVGDSHGLEVVLFSLVCWAVLGLAVYAGLQASRHLRLAGWLPLLLMVVCLLALYPAGSSARHQAQLPASMPIGRQLGQHLLQMAEGGLQHMMQTAETRVAGHFSIGAGALLALLGSITLAARATTVWLHDRPSRAGDQSPAG